MTLGAYILKISEEARYPAWMRLRRVRLEDINRKNIVDRRCRIKSVTIKPGYGPRLTPAGR